MIARLARETEGRVVGIKDSSGDIPYCREIVAAVASFRVFPSNETALVTARADGFAGCISATANISAPLCAKVWAASDDAKTVAEIAHIRGRASEVPLIAAVKHLISRRFGDAAWERVLPPLVELSEEEKQRLLDITPPA